MAKTTDLEARIAQLEAALAKVGVAVEKASGLPEDRPDYIAFGSPEHARFIGLVLIKDPAEADGRVVYTSRQTKQLYCLEDELGILRYYPGMDPDKAALTVLRQKVSVFESGVPQPPDNAPPMWTPELAAVR